VAPRFGGGLEAAKTARKIHGTSSNKCFGMQNVCDVLILKRKPKKNTAGEERSGVKSAVHTPTGLIRPINIFVVSSTASFISTGDD
jgi:hypothetical protein